MKYVISTVVCLGAAIVSFAASAQTYQWKDGSGRTVISDTPPPGNARATRSLGGPASPADGSAPKTLADRELEFRKRQQDAKERAEREAKEEAAAARKRDNCERARSQLAALESARPLRMVDDKGEGQLLDDAARQREMERARQIMAESCK